MAGQRQQQAIGGTLCASVARARLRQDDILGRLGGEARPKARPFIKRQKPEPSSSQLLGSGCLRHADITTAGREEVPAHAITQPVRSAPKKSQSMSAGLGHTWPGSGVEGISPFYQSECFTCPRKVGQRQTRLAGCIQTDGDAAERSCPLLRQQILRSSHFSPIGMFRSRKGELALQGE